MKDYILLLIPSLGRAVGTGPKLAYIHVLRHRKTTKVLSSSKVMCRVVEGTLPDSQAALNDGSSETTHIPGAGQRHLYGH